MAVASRSRHKQEQKIQEDSQQQETLAGEKEDARVTDAAPAGAASGAGAVLAPAPAPAAAAAGELVGDAETRTERAPLVEPAEKYLGFNLQELVDDEMNFIEDYTSDGIVALEEAFQDVIKEKELRWDEESKRRLRKTSDALSNAITLRFKQDMDVYEAYLKKHLFGFPPDLLEAAKRGEGTKWAAAKKAAEEENETRRRNEAAQGLLTGAAQQAAAAESEAPKLEDLTTLPQLMQLLRASSNEIDLEAREAELDEELRVEREKLRRATQENKRLEQEEQTWASNAAQTKECAKGVAEVLQSSGTLSRSPGAMKELKAMLKLLSSVEERAKRVEGLGEAANKLLPSLRGGGEEEEDDGAVDGDEEGVGGGVGGVAGGGGRLGGRPGGGGRGGRPKMAPLGAAFSAMGGKVVAREVSTLNSKLRGRRGSRGGGGRGSNSSNSSADGIARPTTLR